MLEIIEEKSKVYSGEQVEGINVGDLPFNRKEQSHRDSFCNECQQKIDQISHGGGRMYGDKEDKQIGIKAVAALTGNSRAWIYELIKENGDYEDKSFPKPVKPEDVKDGKRRRNKWSYLAVQKYINDYFSNKN